MTQDDTSPSPTAEELSQAFARMQWEVPGGNKFVSREMSEKIAEYYCNAALKIGITAYIVAERDRNGDDNNFALVMDAAEAKKLLKFSPEENQLSGDRVSLSIPSGVLGAMRNTEWKRDNDRLVSLTSFSEGMVISLIDGFRRYGIGTQEIIEDMEGKYILVLDAEQAKMRGKEIGMHGSATDTAEDVVRRYETIISRSDEAMKFLKGLRIKISDESDKGPGRG